MAQGHCWGHLCLCGAQEGTEASQACGPDLLSRRVWQTPAPRQSSAGVQDTGPGWLASGAEVTLSREARAQSQAQSQPGPGAQQRGRPLPPREVQPERGQQHLVSSPVVSSGALAAHDNDLEP